ncbi:hypothetical protein OKW33_006074 [Paraburkholderia atlantica]|uniref:Uncharacterized protein n=1 Tax=Paraburkholderia atlantica TaxID=2654982 RepID=A0A7W8QGG9_PARAM|nr:hypothetical protein [Paraburkholderia atlantica]
MEHANHSLTLTATGTAMQIRNGQPEFLTDIRKRYAVRGRFRKRKIIYDRPRFCNAEWMHGWLA